MWAYREVFYIGNAYSGITRAVSILIHGKEHAILERQTIQKTRAPDLRVLFVYQYFHENYLVTCSCIRSLLFTLGFIRDV